MKKNIQILVIEDNEDDALLEIDELRKSGLKVEYERVETAEALMTSLNAKDWDCIISDYSMPRFSGLEALRLLKETQKDIPFILISGAVGEETAVEAMKAGAHDYIMKNNMKRLPPALEREIREAGIRKEKKMAEATIRYERMLLRTLIDNLPDSIYIKDSNACRVVSNTADYSLLGCKSEEEVIGKTDKELYTNQSGYINYDDDLAVIRTGNAVINREEEFIDSDGKQHWVLSTKVPLRNEQDEITGLVGMRNDITYRKQAEFALMESERILKKQNHEYQVLNREYLSLNDELRKSFEQIQNINSELIVAKNRAEESDKLKSAFLANMSHEIRTPLNAILGFSAYLKDEDLEKQKTTHYVEIIEASGKQLLTIINDILDISQIEAGQLNIIEESVNINHMCHELHDQFSELLGQRPVSLILEIKKIPENLEILTDNNRLRQVLCNLLDNAMKFTSEGRIEFGCRLDKEQLEFFVIDTGIGISPENHSLIFKPFRQVETTTTRNYRGNGLGLSISRALVEKMGGKLFFTSEPGKGSAFRFRIPCKLAKRMNLYTETTVAGNEPRDWNHHLVLVVEDEIYNYSYIESLLSSTRVKILHAWNGEEAVKMVKENPDISLVLMDIRMPVMDGYTATGKIKELRPQLPVIAQTAFAFSEDKEKALKVGFDNYITKPSPKKMIVDVLEGYLN